LNLFQFSSLKILFLTGENMKNNGATEGVYISQSGIKGFYQVIFGEVIDKPNHQGKFGA